MFTLRIFVALAKVWKPSILAAGQNACICGSVPILGSFRSKWLGSRPWIFSFRQETFKNYKGVSSSFEIDKERVWGYTITTPMQGR